MLEEFRRADSSRKIFSMADQIAFAKISGDYNPMHMSPLAARRTPAGACVVHGVQALLWALEAVASFVSLDNVSALDADFAQFIYLDEEVSCFITDLSEVILKIELRVGDARVAQYSLKYGPKISVMDDSTDQHDLIFPNTMLEARDLTWGEVQSARGRVAYFSASVEPYPNLTQAFGVGRLSGILALTRLVGMVCPGLHSTFHRINLHFTEESPAIGGLDFSVSASETRFSIATLAVKADGIMGTIKASRRRPPVSQPDCATLRHLVAPDEFKGHTALVIGGSRGIGEVTAKILALGGAETFITYTNGEADAKRVADDILQSGGRAKIIPLDVLSSISPSLKILQINFSSVYYFATPRITMRASPAYSPGLFRKFLDIYVEAFYSICLELAEKRTEPLMVFYPSTAYVSETTKNMAEYAMAKAAGEVLAADLTRVQRFLNIDVERLPRTQTDQTTSMIDQSMLDVTSVMLPIIKRIEGKVFFRTNSAIVSPGE